VQSVSYGDLTTIREVELVVFRKSRARAKCRRRARRWRQA